MTKSLLTHPLRAATWSFFLFSSALTIGLTAAIAAPGAALKVKADCVVKDVEKNLKPKKPEALETVVIRDSTRTRIEASEPQILVDPKGHQIFYQVIAPETPERPTLLMLPGVNRSMLPKDSAVQALAERGYGVAMLQYSTQPHSIDGLSPEVRPYFRDQPVSLDNLVAEITQVADHLRQTGTRKLIPLSLSFSGATSARLIGYPAIIDVVPMTSHAAANPTHAMISGSLKGMRLFNPMGADWMQRRMLDQNYRIHWNKEAKEKIAEYDFRPDARENMVEGYSSMSRAIEGFSWKNESPDKNTRRLFVIAENDQKELLADQVATYRRLKAEGYALNLVIVQNAAHRIPLSHPDSYSRLVDEFLKSNGFNSDLSVLDPKAGSFQAVSATDEDRVLNKMISEAKTFMEHAAMNAGKR